MANPRKLLHERSAALSTPTSAPLRERFDVFDRVAATLWRKAAIHACHAVRVILRKHLLLEAVASGEAYETVEVLTACLARYFGRAQSPPKKKRTEPKSQGGCASGRTAAPRPAVHQQRHDKLAASQEDC